MKVIGQLINYFQRQGALSPEQLDYLERHGFLARTSDDDTGHDDTMLEPDARRRPVPPEDEDSSVLRPPIKRGKSGAPRAGQQVTAREIADWLQQQFPDWAPAFAGLEQLARRFSACDNWQDAMTVLRRAPDEQLQTALAQGLSRREISLAAIWESLGFDAYQEVATREGLRGPAISAYRAILAAYDVSHVTKHQWLLREVPVADIYNLLHSQRRVARLMGKVIDEDGPLVSSALRREPHRLAYWTLVIIYNALRGTSPHGSLTHREYGPLLWLGDDLENGLAIVTSGEGGRRCGPEYEDWMRAWSLALMMNPNFVTSYFVASVNSDDPTPLWCPAGWHWKAKSH